MATTEVGSSLNGLVYSVFDSLIHEDLRMMMKMNS